MATKKKTSKKTSAKTAQGIKILKGDGEKVRKEVDRVLKLMTQCDKQVKALDPESAGDADAKKLGELIKKRQQLFQMLASIIDKYDETAKNVIQSIGR